MQKAIFAEAPPPSVTGAVAAVAAAAAVTGAAAAAAAGIAAAAAAGTAAAAAASISCSAAGSAAMGAGSHPSGRGVDPAGAGAHAMAASARARLIRADPIGGGPGTCSGMRKPSPEAPSRAPSPKRRPNRHRALKKRVTGSSRDCRAKGCTWCFQKSAYGQRYARPRNHAGTICALLPHTNRPTDGRAGASCGCANVSRPTPGLTHHSHAQGTGSKVPVPTEPLSHLRAPPTRGAPRKATRRRVLSNDRRMPHRSHATSPSLTR